MDIKILTIPGYCGSGEEHWQSYWERELFNVERVEQDDWNNPELKLWVERLNSYIKGNQSYILVAHSLGCSLVAHWAARYDASLIKGALLVSVSDVDSAEYTLDELRGFSPMPMKELPFKSIVVASENDPYVSLQRARQVANAWGSGFKNIGSFGHINAETKLASWSYGKSLLNKLLPV